jgi:hypothetical protein
VYEPGTSIATSWADSHEAIPHAIERKGCQQFSHFRTNQTLLLRVRLMRLTDNITLKLFVVILIRWA